MSDLIAQVMRASAGSRHGMHYYSNAAKCGMRAMLSDKDRTDETVELAPSEDKIALRVGTLYHRLHEMWRLGMFPEADDAAVATAISPLGPLVSHSDASLQEALRLFHAYQMHWPRDLWGRVHGIELALPQNAMQAELIRTRFGGVDVTGKLDMVVHLDEAALAQAQERCAEITEPGTYIVDWKTAARTPDPLLYQLDVQALWYPTLYQLCMSESEGGREMLARYPVRGTIFDVIIKQQRKREPAFNLGDFACVYAAAPDVEQATAELQGLIEQGVFNVEQAQKHNVGNRAECVNERYGSANICPYYGTKCLQGVTC